MGKRVRNVPTIADLDARFRVMDEFGEYCQFLTLPAPPIETMAAPDKSPEFARIANDGLAELVAQYPDRFIGFAASLPMNNVEAYLKEIDRSVTQLGARGFQIYTNVAGKPLDLPGVCAPLRRRGAARSYPSGCTRRAAPISPTIRPRTKSKYEIWWTFGWPYETSAAMSRIVFSGMFDRHPNLRIVTHHMGGMIPYFEGRVGYGWDALGSRTSDEDYVSLRKSMKKRPIDYFRNFYADTALFGGLAATKNGLDFFGVDHAVFASDVPFEPAPGLYIRETIRCIEGLDISAADKAKIY